MLPKVAIIVLNWNGFNDTSECLESLKSIHYGNYEIILVDNNSQGNEYQILKEKYNGFVSWFIKNDYNIGFAGGNNSGIKIALKNNFDYILLLNNDTVVEPDFLNRLIEYAEKNKKIGILTPKIIYHSNRNLIWAAGGYISKIRASGFSYGLNKSATTNNKERFCSFASGCCLLIRTEVFNEIGLLDDSYFLYLEDTDFCYKVNKSGYKILYIPSSIIYHKVSSSTSKESSILPLYYSIRNRLYFARKNLGFYYYLALIYVIIASLVKIIFSREQKIKFKIFVSAIKDFFSGKIGYKKL
ncbi:MAG: glycosyltransferase family 2 protein [Melioribacter sp.]|uniref:glycosyltransferase family 2 protein n=1 Tax=Rosettibacter primus TaxID=3111523 RepID=UPI00247B342D|nr:glycosyltransferase family 2 protein [Melioribacter sp.]